MRKIQKHIYIRIDLFNIFLTYTFLYYMDGVWKELREQDDDMWPLYARCIVSNHMGDLSETIVKFGPHMV